MSKIPYIFETPIPKYFRDNGWMKKPNMAAFLSWCFSRCSSETRMIFHLQKAIHLEPFEFIFGRRQCSLETGLTEDEIRGCIYQLNKTNNGEILKKIPSKTTNKFTVYKWSTNIFSLYPQQNPQQNPQQKNHSQYNQNQYFEKEQQAKSPAKSPTEPHNLEDKKIKEEDDDYARADEKIVEMFISHFQHEGYSSQEIMTAIGKMEKSKTDILDKKQYLGKILENSRRNQNANTNRRSSRKPNFVQREIYNPGHSLSYSPS